MKKLLFLIITVLCNLSTFSQTEKTFDPKKITFGGGFGLQFGDYTTINIAPQVGYTFNKYLNAGAGINYTYYKDEYHIAYEKIKNTRSYFGLNLYGRLYPTNFLVFAIQPEANRMWSSLKSERTSQKYTENKFVPVVLIGGGLRFGPVTAMLKYDLIQDENSPYGNKIFYSLGYTWSF